MEVEESELLKELEELCMEERNNEDLFNANKVRINQRKEELQYGATKDATRHTKRSSSRNGSLSKQQSSRIDSTRDSNTLNSKR